MINRVCDAISPASQKTNCSIVNVWLGREKASSQSKYQAELESITAPEACAHLETDDQLNRWYTKDGCQSVAIIGDTGFGKSVSMSFLIVLLGKWNSVQVVCPKLCFHFCRDGSTGNITNILCGLIYSLLQQLPGLTKVFVKWYRTIQQEHGTPDPAADPERLIAFLENTVQSLDRPLLLLIDGLDECDRKSRNTLLDFLPRMASMNKQVKYLLSSRPQEEILEALGNTNLIHLGPNLERDRAIVRKLVNQRLRHLSENVKHMIRETLAPLAQGSGIWAKMIVATIEGSGIRAESPMSELLMGLPLPSELSKLYSDIFERYTSNNKQNKALALLALNFLAAARRDLSIKELTCAVTLGIAPKSVTTVAEVEKSMDCQRLMDIIQPFISQVDFQDLAIRQVRLVHQSVKEFIVENSDCHGHDSGIRAEQAAAHIVGQRVDKLERSVLQICVRYLLLDNIATQSLFSSTQAAIIELPQEVDLFSEEEGPNNYTIECSWDTWEEGMTRYDPTERGFGDFFAYAASFWLDHFGHVSRDSLPIVADIEKLCCAKSLRLDNWTQQNCRPGCTIQARYEFDSKRYDPLSIVSLYGSEATLHQLLENADFSGGCYLPDSPIAAAEHILEWGDLSNPVGGAEQTLQSGNLSRLGILFRYDGFKSQLHTLKFFRLLIRQWSSFKTRHSNWDEAFDLVNQAFGAMVTEQWGNELLSLAARARCKPMLQRLMREAEHDPGLKAELWRDPTSPVPNDYMQNSRDSVGGAMVLNGMDVPRYLPDTDNIEALIERVNMRDQTMPRTAADSSNRTIEEISSKIDKGNAVVSEKTATTEQGQGTLDTEHTTRLKTRGTW